MSDPKIRPYFESGRGRTSWLQLMEVYYALLRDGGPRQRAREIVASFEPVLIDFSLPEILDAMDMRARWPRGRSRISYVDAVGYHVAQRRRLRFLTGDPAFKGLRGVAFIRIARP